jgi:O-antigen ligase
LFRRIQLFDIVFVILLVVWLSRTPRIFERLGDVPLKWPLLLYIGITWLSLLSADDIILALLDAVIKTYLVLVFVIVTTIITTKEQLFKTIRLWIAITTIVCLIGLIGYCVALITGQENFFVYAGRDMPFFGHTFRLKSTLQPTSKLLSTYLIVGIPVTIFYISEISNGYRKKSIMVFSFIVIFVADILTLSRGIVPAIFAFGFVFRRCNINSRIRRLISTTLIVLSMIGMLAIGIVSSIKIISIKSSHISDPSKQVFDKYYYATDPSRGLETITVSIDYAYDSYFWLKRAALLMFREAPLLGIGPGNFGIKLIQYKNAGLLPEHLPNFPTAQSEAFDRLAETGLFGLISLTVLVVALLASLVKKYLVGNSVESNLTWVAIAVFFGIILTSIDLDVSHFRFLWVFFGIILGINSLGDQPHRQKQKNKPETTL